jgi:DeoR/GlpR family transcriptional regulator of sugar metabolism
MFPGLSKRTVRNDLAYLIKLGKILREGQGSSTLYKLL